MSEWINKHPYNRILLSYSDIKRSKLFVNPKTWIAWKKADLKSYILHDCICMTFWKGKTVGRKKRVLGVGGWESIWQQNGTQGSFLGGWKVSWSRLWCWIHICPHMLGHTELCTTRKTWQYLNLKQFKMHKETSIKRSKQ